FRRESDYGTIQALLHEPIPELRTLEAEVPDELNEIGRRAVARAVEHRYRTAGQLRDDLEAFIQGASSPADAQTVGDYVRRLIDDASRASPGSFNEEIITARIEILDSRGNG